MPSKHILITGATGGIGQALAKRYATSGVRLSLLGRKLQSLQELAKICQDQGAITNFFTCDLRDTQPLTELIQTIDSENSIDLIIANAGVAVYLDKQNNHATRESWEEIEKTIDINLKGTIATITPLIPRMQSRKKGQIALISSLAAYQGIAISPSYCASKAGIKAYGESLRLLLKPNNISVSVICPGFVESDMSQRFPGKKPFLLTADQAARRIQKGLNRKRGNITFPILLGWGTRLLNLLPIPISELILKNLAYALPKHT